MIFFGENSMYFKKLFGKHFAIISEVHWLGVLCKSTLSWLSFCLLFFYWVSLHRSVGVCKHNCEFVYFSFPVSLCSLLFEVLYKAHLYLLMLCLPLELICFSYCPSLFLMLFLCLYINKSILCYYHSHCSFILRNFFMEYMFYPFIFTCHLLYLKSGF